MILKNNKPKKILAPGLHLVTIKDVSAVMAKDSKVPASWIDVDDHDKPKGAMRVLFMGKNQFGIEHDFWLGKSRLKSSNAMCVAIGVTPPVHKDTVIGKKLYVLVAKVLVFDNGVSRINGDKTQVCFSKLIAENFWSAGKRPEISGDPEMNGGECSGEFLWHWDSGKYFPSPLGNYVNKVSPESIDVISSEIQKIRNETLSKINSSLSEAYKSKEKISEAIRPILKFGE